MLERSAHQYHYITNINALIKHAIDWLVAWQSALTCPSVSAVAPEHNLKWFQTKAPQHRHTMEFTEAKKKQIRTVLYLIDSSLVTSSVKQNRFRRMSRWGVEHFSIYRNLYATWTNDVAKVAIQCHYWSHVKFDWQFATRMRWFCPGMLLVLRTFFTIMYNIAQYRR